MFRRYLGIQFLNSCVADIRIVGEDKHDAGSQPRVIHQFPETLKSLNGDVSIA